MTRTRAVIGPRELTLRKRDTELVSNSRSLLCHLARAEGVEGVSYGDPLACRLRYYTFNYMLLLTSSGARRPVVPLRVAGVAVVGA